MSRRSLNRRDHSVVEINQGETATPAFAGVCRFPGDCKGGNTRAAAKQFGGYRREKRRRVEQLGHALRVSPGSTTGFDAGCDATVGEFSSAGDLTCWPISAVSAELKSGGAGRAGPQRVPALPKSSGPGTRSGDGFFQRKIVSDRAVPQHRDTPGSHHFQNSEFTHAFDECFNLVFTS